MFRFFRKPPDLKRAIAAVNSKRTAQNQRALEDALKSNTLFLASEDVPPHWKGVVVLDEEVNIPVLTSEAPGGGTALLCVTDKEEVRRRTHSATGFGLELPAICHLVVRHNYAGIIINPAGPWAGLPTQRLKELTGAV